MWLQGQTTIPRLLALLQHLGIDISKRRIVRLLCGKQGAYLAEAAVVLRAGLGPASLITVDDTGARHKARNGFFAFVPLRGPQKIYYLSLVLSL
jgi:hypothetical protein